MSRSGGDGVLGVGEEGVGSGRGCRGRGREVGELGGVGEGLASEKEEKEKREKKGGWEAEAEEGSGRVEAD